MALRLTTLLRPSTQSLAVALDISDLPTRQPCLCRQRVALPWAIVRSQWLLHLHGLHYHLSLIHI